MAGDEVSGKGTIRRWDPTGGLWKADGQDDQTNSAHRIMIDPQSTALDHDLSMSNQQGEVGKSIGYRGIEELPGIVRATFVRKTPSALATSAVARTAKSTEAIPATLPIKATGKKKTAKKSRAGGRAVGKASKGKAASSRKGSAKRKSSAKRNAKQKPRAKQKLAAKRKPSANRRAAAKPKVSAKRKARRKKK